MSILNWGWSSKKEEPVIGIWYKPKDGDSIYLDNYTAYFIKLDKKSYCRLRQENEYQSIKIVSYNSINSDNSIFVSISLFPERFDLNKWVPVIDSATIVKLEKISDCEIKKKAREAKELKEFQEELIQKSLNKFFEENSICKEDKYVMGIDLAKE